MPMKPQNIPDEVSAQEEERAAKGGTSFRSNFERQINFKNSAVKSSAFKRPVCQPKPLKAGDLENRASEEDHLKN